jgi:glucans biosynthesis protein C
MNNNSTTTIEQKSETLINQQKRLYDFDWLRVLAFGGLVFYHAGLIFGPEWFVVNKEKSQIIMLATEFVSQFRMPLIFIISGLGVSFALRRHCAASFLKERVQRLLIPLIFGSLFITPPQLYYGRMFKGESVPSYFNFQLNVFDLDISSGGNLYWAHLWFIAYLFVFTIVSLPIFILLRRDSSKRRIDNLISALTNKIWYSFLLIVPLLFVVLVSKFYLDGAGGRIRFLFFFIYGYAFFSNHKFYTLFQKYRHHFLGCAIISNILYFSIKNIIDEAQLIPLALLIVISYLNIFFLIYAIIGYAKAHLNFNTPLLRYVNEAVYPFYILHQTIMVIIGFYTIQLEVSIFNKFFLITSGTFVITLLIYEYFIRRFNITRLVFGLKPIPKKIPNFVLTK